MAKLQVFASMIENFATIAADRNAMEVARAVLRDSGIRDDVYRDNSVEGKARQENIEELLNGIQDFVDVRREEGNANDKLVDFLSEVSLMSDLDNDDDAEGEHITLMTIHSAKGLEFRTVFIVGLEEDLFPNQCAQSSLRELEEDGFIHREIYKEIPPKVEYTLTELGESFIPVLQTMMNWSEKYLCPDYQNPYET